VLDVLGDRGVLLDSLLHNTASPTVIRTGKKFNVIPAEISVTIDARMLPGFEPAALVKEVTDLIGDGVELEVIHHDPGPADPDMTLYPMLGQILREADPGSTPTPLLMPGVSDARFISRLGIQTYGFLPMNLPAGFDFWKTVHGADERVPIEAVGFGSDAIYKAIERYRVPA
jgi:acetylornithine deacetylase/succinyl-diaminopimelate desuccinylase-like protein